MDEDREPPEEPDATAGGDASADDRDGEGDADPAPDGSGASDAGDDAAAPPGCDGDGTGSPEPSDTNSPVGVPSTHSPGSGSPGGDASPGDAEDSDGGVDEAIVAGGEVDDADDVDDVDDVDEVDEEAIEAQIGVMENEGADGAGSSAYPDFVDPPEFESETVDSFDEDADFSGMTDDFGGIDGPQSDEEMPLADHIEEMLKRLAVVVAIAGLVSIVTFPFAERIINFLWFSVLPGVPSDIARPRVYGILELKLTELKVASLAGLIVALPVVVYETYQFMRPGLYPNERRYYLAAIPTSLVLALVGVSFAYFIVLPAIFSYFLYYSQDVANIGFALGKTFNLILVLMGYLALVFQIPLFIMLAMMMGLVTRRWLAARRLLFWGAFLGISFIFSPDPTGMAPIIIALTMIVLFEGTLLLTKWTGRG